MNLENITQIVAWIQENRELLAVIASLAVYIVRLTKWGKANSEVVDKIVSVIEKNKGKNSEEIKAEIASLPLSPNAQDVLDDKVAAHDETKPTPTTTAIVTRELCKTVGLRIKKKAPEPEPLQDEIPLPELTEEDTIIEQ